MARILEHRVKDLFKQFGIPVPQYYACASEAEVREAAGKINKKVVVKALVPVGGRGKSGAVKFAEDANEAVASSKELLNRDIKRWPCRQVLIEEFVPATDEYYVSITFDSRSRGPVIILGCQGGIGVEENASALKKFPVDIRQGLRGYAAREMWEQAGLAGKLLRPAGELLENIYRLFCECSGKLIEINPLLRTADDKFVAADAVLIVDDEGIKKRPALMEIVEYGVENFGRPPTEREQEMIRIDQLDPYRGTARFVELGEGDIGFMCGGGGGSLVMMDTVTRYHGRPLNYTEMGGNPTERKMLGLAKTVLSQPGLKGFLRVGNISSNTQVDIVAKALVKAVAELGIDPKKIPMVVRAAGLHEDEGRKILEEAGIAYFSDEYTMVQAGKKLLEMMRQKAAEEAVESGKAEVILK
jgi:succinyl-CoA synthetase beta subunit/citryl-CoA synthetase large subunit